MDTKDEEFEIQMDQGPFITYLQLGVRNTFVDDLKAVKALSKRYRFSDGLRYTYNEITDHVFNSRFDLGVHFFKQKTDIEKIDHRK